MVGEAPQSRPINVHDVDLGIAVAVRGERQARAVRRVHRQIVLRRRRAFGRRQEGPFENPRDVHIHIAGAPRRVGDGAAVRRPRRRVVQLSADRDPPLVAAIVVGDVDLFHVALLDRPHDWLEIAIRHERQLGARHPAQRPLRFVNLVGDGVRVETRIGRRPAVFLAEDLLSRRHAVQAHLHSHGGTRLCDGADDQAVGTKLAPPIEGLFTDRRRDRDRLISVARNHVELALVVEVVPQHLADRSRNLLRLADRSRARGNRGRPVAAGSRDHP